MNGHQQKQGANIDPQKLQLIMKGRDIAGGMKYGDGSKDGVFGSIAKGMEQQGDKKFLIASVVSKIVTNTMAQLQSNDPFVALALIVGELADVNSAIDETGRQGLDQKNVEQAAEIAVNMFLESNRGKIDDAAVRAMLGGV